jgi:RimJ/RimL family protein N-acetyltransferase
MDKPLQLQSPRLNLRGLRPEDAAAICAYRALPEVARFQSWQSFGPADADRLIADQAGIVPDTPGTWQQLALITRDAGEMIGDCGIHFPKDDLNQVELGITLSPTHQRQGLAAEALQSVLRYAFESLGKHRAWAITDAQNHAAARLFRSLGFRQEAHFVEHVRFKGAWSSEYLFALLYREWQQRP